MTVTVGGREITVEVCVTEEQRFTRWSLALPRRFPQFSIDAGGVRTDDDARLVRRAWEPADAQAIMRVHKDAHLRCDGASLQLSGPPVTRTEEVIAGLQFLTSVASRDPYGIEILRALPDAKLAGDQAHLPGGIRVGPFELQSRLITRALGPCSPECRFHFAVSDGVASGSDLECLPVDARSYVQALGTVQVLVSDGEAQIRWLTIETDRARLVAAVAVLRSLSRGPSLGVFR